MPFRPEEALTHLQLAELLLDPSTGPALSGAEGSGQGKNQDRAEALEHLEAAIAEFREMKMQPSLERAEAGPVRAPTYPAGLSQREVEVLRLISAGKTDREIAEELFISFRTVGNHVRNILNKTNTANRTEAATFAAHQGLT